MTQFQQPQQWAQPPTGQQIKDAVYAEVVEPQMQPPVQAQAPQVYVPPTQNQLIKTLDETTNFENMVTMANVLVAGRMVPFKTTEEAITAIIMSKSLGVDVGIGMNHIYNIEGKAAISVHLMVMLLRRAGCEIETLENMVPLYDEHGNQVDTRHTVAIHKWSRLLGRVITETLSVTWSQMAAAGWTTNRSWKKMPFVMMPHRVKTMAIRNFAPEVTLGFYEVTEIADVKGQEYDISEDAQQVTFVQPNHQKR